jgi:hypothetical protein
MLALAAAYEKAPALDPRAIRSWRALAEHSVRTARHLRTSYRITLTGSEPYPNATEMLADIGKGSLRVSALNCGHPVWTPSENIAFRIVHDILGHGISGGDFSWLGESKACKAHEQIVPLLALPALFTECLAQVAYQQTFGHFGPQKVCLL